MSRRAKRKVVDFKRQAETVKASLLSPPACQELSSPLVSLMLAYLSVLRLYLFR